MEVKCPNHPDKNLRIGADYSKTYIRGENNPKLNEVSGVGFCPTCNCYRGFTVKK